MNVPELSPSHFASEKTLASVKQIVTNLIEWLSTLSYSHTNLGDTEDKKASITSASLTQYLTLSKSPRNSSE